MNSVVSRIQTKVILKNREYKIKVKCPNIRKKAKKTKLRKKKNLFWISQKT